MVTTVPPKPPSASPPSSNSPPQRPVARRFSNVFIPGTLKKQSELDFVDVLVDTDIPLFVDPFAFKIGTSDFAEECNDLVVNFFQSLIDSLRAGRPIRAQSLLNNLHEPNETRLGLSKGMPQGRGVGGMQAKALYNAFAKSNAIKTGLLEDLSDCELFIDGISHDKISDITINIIRRKLVEFTKVQCTHWNIPMQFKPPGPFWDGVAKEWCSGYDKLPVYKDYPIILVPKRAVRYKLAIDDRDYYNFHVVDFLKQEFERQESVNSAYALTRVLQSGRRITKKEIKEKHPFSKTSLLEFSEQHPEVLNKYKEEVQAKVIKNGTPTDGGLFEMIKNTAHKQSFILAEEVNLNYTYNVGGSNYGVVGQGNRVSIGSIAVYKSEVDAEQNIDVEMKGLLKQAIDAIDASEAKADDKEDAKENLHKLTEELKNPTKEPGRICRFFNRIAEVLPPVATILSNGKAIAEVVKAASS